MTLKELAATALRGTARTDLSTPTVGTLGEALNRVTADSPERLLLGRAALAGLYARAGMTLDAAQSPPPETLPPATHPLPSQFWPLLRRVVGTPFGLAALDNIRERGWTLSAAQVLSLRSEQADIIHEFWPLLDERGKAVLDAHPMHKAWEKAEAEAQWQSRLSAMQELRQTDATAGAARTWQLWQEIDADEKRDLLDLLESHLLPEDLPLLEHAAKDRSSEVQRRARMLQGHLPGPLQDELLALLRQTVNISGTAKKPRFVIGPFDLPEVLLQPKKRNHGDSDLSRLLGALPVSLILKTLDISQEAFSIAARSQDWSLSEQWEKRLPLEQTTESTTLSELLLGSSGAVEQVLHDKLNHWQDDAPDEQLKLTRQILEKVQRDGLNWRLATALKYAAAFLPTDTAISEPEPLPLVFPDLAGGLPKRLTREQWESNLRILHEQRQAEAEAAWRELTDILRRRREWAQALEEWK
ncbi:DUF5691 domain-containing protein [Deinococcus sp. SL84]|uniref:DUF5691 domain-containing protein n=1 Tax=Deinococcus sp. SL84 TaxID=2994663 RepID=UPI002274BA96|nr:DUF5691 domain-containing protein [Deinococcus sp. SL84]MCY1704311.1 DUF5691 domain-containing protein [Deinococcus sp. SL84]